MTDPIEQRDVAGMIELARRDDWHKHFVGSDIRWMLAEIERLRARWADVDRIATRCVELDDRLRRVEECLSRDAEHEYQCAIMVADALAIIREAESD